VALEPFSGVTTTYAVSAGGKILQAYNVSPPPGSMAGPRRSVRRFNADGTRDFSFDERTGANGNITRLHPLRDGRLLVAGDFTHFDGINRPHLVRLVATNGVELQAPALVSLAPEAIAVHPGEPVTVAAIFAGTAPLALSSSLGSVAVENGVATVRIQTDISGTYLLTLTASNGVGTTRSLPIRIAVAPSVPILRMQPPATLFVRPGRAITLAVEAIGSAPFTYEWYRNGVLVGTTASLVLSNASAVDAGDYTVVVRNPIGAITSDTTRLTLDAGPRLTNISTRATVAAGEQVLIAGFVISGSAKKDLLIRGVGPALAPFGVTGTLPNPLISLHDAAGRILATNDDWSTNFTPPSLFTTLGAFSFGASTADSALRVALDPGAYTLHVSDAAGRSGIALAEIYEADGLPTRLANLSARAFVGVGGSIAISGFVVQGQQPGRFLIRAVGPTLADFGVTNPLADPIVNVTTPTGIDLATNDNWPTNAAEVTGAGAQVAAFPLRPTSRDAALVITLPAGNYTAHVSGLNGTSGIALVEIYELPE
jgi:hypothetical protein